MRDITTILAELFGDKDSTELQDLDGVAIFSKDSNLRYTYVSPEFVKLLNLKSADQILGKKDEDILTMVESLEDHIRTDLEALNGSTIKGLILSGPSDEAGRTKYYYVNKAPYIDEKNNERYIIGTVLDYTIRQTAKILQNKQLSHFHSLPKDMFAFFYVDITDWTILSGAYRVSNKTFSVDTESDFSTIVKFIMETRSTDVSFDDFLLTFNKDNLLKQYNMGLPGDKYIYSATNVDSSIIYFSLEYIFVTNPYSDHICCYLLSYDKSSFFNERKNILLSAEQDFLTGILNRKTALSLINRYLSSHGKGLLHALLICDANNFKSINDHYGHKKGDEILHAIAQSLNSFFYDTDIVGRLGGDEFIVLMKNVKSYEDVKKKVTKLIEQMQFSVDGELGKFLVTISAGVTLFIGGESDLDSLYSDADEALYAAKKTKTRTFCFSKRTKNSTVPAIEEVQEESAPFNLVDVIRNMHGTLLIADISKDNIAIVFSSAPSHETDRIILNINNNKEPFLSKFQNATETSDTFEFELKCISPFNVPPTWLRFSGTCSRKDENTIRSVFIVNQISGLNERAALESILQSKQELMLSLSPVITWEYDVKNRVIAQSGLAKRILSPSLSSDIPQTFDVDAPGPVTAKSVNEYARIYQSIEEGKEQGTAEVEFAFFFGLSGPAKVAYKTIFDDNNEPQVAVLVATELVKSPGHSNYAQIQANFNERAKENTTCFELNLTTNKIEFSTFSKDSYFDCSVFESPDALFAYIVQRCDVAEESREILSTQIARDFYNVAIKNGIHTIHDEGRMFVSKNHSEWFTIDIYLTTNPTTLDNKAFFIIENVDKDRSSKQIVDNMIQNSCDEMFVIDTITKDVRIVFLKPSNYATKLLLSRDNRYEYFINNVLDSVVVEDELLASKESLSINVVLENLRRYGVYNVYLSTYDKNMETRRKSLIFNFLDKNERVFSCMILDITNSSYLEYNRATGLINKRTFGRAVKKLIKENPEENFVFIRWDIDNFKVFNDLFGSKAGDEVLLSLGNSMRTLNNDKTIVGSLDGDVFGMCLPANLFIPFKFTSWIAEILNDIVTDYTFSFHVSGYVINDPLDEFGSMCDRALIALKTIKSSLDTRFIWYDESMREVYLAEQTMLADLRHASPDDFVIYIQPQYNQDTDTLIGGEVLVRWIHPKKGLISPGIFIPIMEKAHLVADLNQIVWEKACKFLRERLDAGKTIVPLSVNVSVQNLFDPNFIKFLTNLLKKYDLEPKYLRLELTESVLMNNLAFIVSVLELLHNRGFTIEIDDFGSGFSSLNVLKSVPCDIIKLDLHFFKLEEEGTAINEKSAVIVASIVGMAHRLNYYVIAEGIETSKQANFLRSINCSMVQGFFYAKPLPLNEFSNRLESKNNLLQMLFNKSSSDDILDNTSMWTPDSLSHMLFSSSMGPMGFFEVADNIIHAIRVNDEFLSEISFPTESMQWSIYNFFQAVYPADKDKISDAFKEAALTNKRVVVSCRFILLHRPGMLKQLKLTIKRVSASSYFNYFFVLVAKEASVITFEEQVYRLVEQTKSLLAKAPVGAVVYQLSLDEKLKLLYINDFLKKLLVVSDEEFETTYSENGFLFIHKISRKSLAKQVSAFVRSPAINANFSFPCQVACGDGKVKNVIISGPTPTILESGNPIVGMLFIAEA